MFPASGPVRLPPMPIWLRILGVAVCLMPGIAALVVFVLSILEQYIPDWNWEETLRAIREIEVASGTQLGSSDSSLPLRS